MSGSVVRIAPEPNSDAERTALPLREVVLEALLQLHVDFGVLGRLEEAGPSLHKLMELAYHVPPATAPRSVSRLLAGSKKRDNKQALQ
jgi:hypothetical protein